MAFLKQISGFGNSCGAFAVAYWHWLATGRKPADGPMPGDEALIKEIYKSVFFGEDAPPGMPNDYCNPVEMIRYMEKKFSTKCMYFTGASNSMIYKIYGDMKTGPQKDIIAGFGSRVAEEPLTEEILKKIPFAIYICDCHLGPHYILMHDNSGKLEYYNSWIGEAKPLPDKFFTGEGVIKDSDVDFKATGAGIVIP